MIPRLHAVTDDRTLERRDFGRVAQEVLRVGGSDLALHVRGPESSGARIYETARGLRPAAAASGATLLVNDRVDVSLVLQLDGVHLGARSLGPVHARRILGSGALVGLSVHGRSDASGSRPGGADYLVVGTIFRTSSHPGRNGAGVGRIREVAAVSRLPLVAIGGIGPERVGKIVAAGAHGVAALSGIWGADRPGRAVRSYLRALATG